jgi:hypothetical protein
VPLTGLTGIGEVWALAGQHTQTHVGPDTLLHRVEFRFLG